MDVIILAAGQGSRLRPYTNEKPKCMVQILDKSILDRQLQTYKSIGIKKVNIVVGYKHDKIKNPMLKKIINTEYESSNMVYSLLQAKSIIEKSTEVIIAYGDIIFTTNVLQKLINCQSPISVVADRDWEGYWSERMENIIDDVESFKVDEENNIIEIGSKVTELSEINGQYIGLIKFKDEGIQALLQLLSNLNFDNPKIKNMYFTDLLQSLINQGNKITPVFINRGWFEIDTKEDKYYTESRIELDL